MFDRYKRLAYNYQSKRGYDSLIQNVIFKQITNSMGTTKVDVDIEIKKKVSRIK